VIIFYSNEKTKCVQTGFFNGVVVVVLEVVNYGCFSLPRWWEILPIWCEFRVYAWFVSLTHWQRVGVELSLCIFIKAIFMVLLIVRHYNRCLLFVTPFFYL
jgi:hypothetical protein